MELILTKYDDNIAILTLNRGVTNPWNLELVNTLREILHQIRDNPKVGGIVLTSPNHKFFSIGFDIPELFPLPKDDFKLFYTSFNQLCLDLFTFPKPVIAAITGHAVAAGCIITMCCDYRFIAEGRKLMGVNEIKIGVPIPYPASCIMQALVGFRTNRDLNDFGEYYPAEELQKMGLVDKVLPLEKVLPESIAHIKKIASFPSYAFSMIKHNRTEVIAERIRAHLTEQDEYFIDCWYSEETRMLLQEAMKKF
jgi:enoyl-CoA hydratase/carnithine racemase